MKIRVNLLIIGGGVIGTAIARVLSRYELNTVLVEKEVEVGFGTSKANSGIIHAGFHEQPGTLKAKLCVSGNAMYDKLCKELDVPLKKIGSLLVALKEKEIDILEKLKIQGVRNGVSGLKIIKGETLFQMEPNLTKKAKAALYAPGVAVVSPYELTMALAENAQQNGVKVILGAKVKNINSLDGMLKCVETTRGSILADYVINAAGLFADEITSMVKARDFTLVFRKGEEYVLDKKIANLVKHVIFPIPQKETKGILIIPTIDGNLMIGPTARKIKEKLDLSTSREDLQVILNKVKKLDPQISSKDIITSFAGIRAGSEKGDFIITPSEKIKGFINVAGIDSPGLTAAPTIAEMVVDILSQEGLKLKEKKDYQPYRKKWVRFRELPFREKGRLAKKDKRYGNIVCRCETVSEMEVIEAIKRGAKTLDGVKFRTRAGMGRCQGGFCTPRIVQILARELGIKVEEVTKRGGKSIVVLMKK